MLEFSLLKNPIAHLNKGCCCSLDHANVYCTYINVVSHVKTPNITTFQESKCAYIVFIMATYWITEALPIAVTSLLPIILTPLVGLGSAKSVSSHYLTVSCNVANIKKSVQSIVQFCMLKYLKSNKENKHKFYMNKSFIRKTI